MIELLDTVLTILFFATGIVLFMNVRALWRDREVKGVSFVPVAIFFIVDLLQAIRFTHYGDYALAGGALILTIASGVWLGLAAFFASTKGSRTNLSPE